jgi:hypothetical protein
MRVLVWFDIDGRSVGLERNMVVVWSRRRKAMWRLEYGGIVLN